MGSLLFRSDLEHGKYPADVNILSVFRQQHRKPLEIEQGMSSGEISDVVSDNIIASVKEQFKKAKRDFNKKSKTTKK